jgi:hypothetical protein
MSVYSITYIYRSITFDRKCYLLPITSLYEMSYIVARKKVSWTLLWTLRTIYNQFTYICWPFWIIFYHLQVKLI